MSTASAIARARIATSALRKRLAAINQLTDDQPADRDTVVPDLVRDACHELDGWLVAVVSAVAAAEDAGRQRRPADVAAALTECTSACREAVHAYVTGIGGVDSLSRLRQLAADRPTAWRRWAWEVQERVGEAWAGISDVRAELDQCWEELVEHLLDDPVDVQARLVATTRTPNDALRGDR